MRAVATDDLHRPLPDLHGVTQTDGLGKTADDTRMRWLPQGEAVPTLGNWFRAAGYDTHYDGKWHISHADLHDEQGRRIETNTADGEPLPDHVQAYLDADPLAPYGFSGWVGPGAARGGDRRQRAAARPAHRGPGRGLARGPLCPPRAGDEDALRPFLLVASFVNPHDIVLFPAWVRRMPIGPGPLDPPT